MKALIGTSFFVATLALAAGPAAAQHHAAHLGAFHPALFHPALHAMAMSGFAGAHHAHHHALHPWVVNSMSFYETTGYPYGYSGYPMYSAYSPAVSYWSSAGATLTTLNWQAAQAREQELRARDQELRAEYLKRDEARRAVHAGRREKRHAEYDRRAAERRAQPARRAAAVPVIRNGKIAWPAVLRGEAYRADREAVERLFAEGPQDGDYGRGSQFTEEVVQRSNAIAAELKRHAREANSNDYVTAKRFVKALAGQACRPETGGQLASR